MADVKISALPSAATASGTDAIPIVQGGTTKQVPASGLTAGVASAVAVGGITGLGTGVATALAVNTGSAGAPVLFNGALGTPASGVATNLTGTAASLTAGTASAVAVGGITGLGTGVATALALNVGSAGAPVTFNGALGTPSSGTATNLAGTAASLVAGNVTNVAVTTTFASDLTALPLNLGGWVEYFVSTNDDTRSATTLADIVGLITGTLTNSAVYEFECNLRFLAAGDTAGHNIGFHVAGTGSAGTVFSMYWFNNTSATNGQVAALNAVDSKSGALLTVNGGEGIVAARGFFTATSTGTSTFSVQWAKVTSNTVTCRKGSVLRVRKAHT